MAAWRDEVKWQLLRNPDQHLKTGVVCTALVALARHAAWATAVRAHCSANDQDCRSCCI